jgi:hypothetical protein
LCGNLEIVPQRRFDPQGDRKRSMREERNSQRRQLRTVSRKLRNEGHNSERIFTL